MTKSPRLIVFLVGSAMIGGAQQTLTVGQAGNLVPAGTLLGCTLDEPNFSSQTARPGDPLLCRTNSAVQMFGRSLIPRGAYLSARLRSYHDPGHFVGKGWLQLEFTSLTLPGGNVPIDAKVITAARYRVNGDGKIQGRGHAKRDAVEWAIPLLWPVKVLTLPARGPRPTLKAETRIELRLMEDLTIPESAYANSSALTPRTSALQPRPDAGGASVPAARNANFRPDSTRVPTQDAMASLEPYGTTPAGNRASPFAAPSRSTLLAMRGGRIFLVGDYWVEKRNLNYTMGGAQHAVSLDSVDIPLTRQLNAERGVSFALSANR